MKKILKIILFTSVSISLVSCARYSAKPLDTLEIKHQKDSVGIATKALSAKESKRYLGKNLLAADIQPLHLVIQNNSDTTYYFNPNRSNMPLIPSQTVAKTLHTDTAARTLGWIPVSLGLGFAAYIGEVMGGSGNFPGREILCVTAVALPVASGANSAIHNAKLDRDYAEKGAHQLILKPHTEYNCIIFVRKNQVGKTFSTTLITEETKKHLTLSTEIS